MNADGPRHLGKARDRFLDLVAGDHHQVGQLVDHHYDEWKRFGGFGVLRRLIGGGATLAAIAQKLPELDAKPRVLGFNYDTGERYLSVPDFLPEQAG